MNKLTEVVGPLGDADVSKSVLHLDMILQRVLVSRVTHELVKNVLKLYVLYSHS